jgi:large subunit ribosomal protein L35
MPKMKTHKVTAKRFKISGGGKLLRTKIGKSHLRRTKPGRVKNLFDKYLEITHPGDKRRIRRLLPYLARKA